MAIDRIAVTACEAVLLDLLAQVRKFCEEQGEADFETGAAEAMKRQIVGQKVDPYLQRQLDRVVSAYAIKPDTTRQQEVGSEPQDCPVCKNGYLAIRTDIYKDGREFVYCDCCGCMADRRVWNRIAAAPSTPENAGGVTPTDGGQSNG